MLSIFLSIFLRSFSRDLTHIFHEEAQSVPHGVVSISDCVVWVKSVPDELNRRFAEAVLHRDPQSKKVLRGKGLGEGYDPVVCNLMACPNKTYPTSNQTIAKLNVYSNDINYCLYVHNTVHYSC